MLTVHRDCAFAEIDIVQGSSVTFLVSPNNVNLFADL